MKHYLPAAQYNLNTPQIVVTDEDMEADAFLDVVDVVGVNVTIKLPAEAARGKTIKISAATGGGPVTVHGNGRLILGSGTTTVIEGATVSYYLSERNVWVPSVSDLIHAIARLSVTATNASGPSLDIALDDSNTFRCSIGTISVVAGGYVNIELNLDEPLPDSLQAGFLTLHVPALTAGFGIAPFIPILVNLGPGVASIAIPFDGGALPISDPISFEIHYLVMRIPIVI